MDSSFLGQAYASRSPILANQTAINIYPILSETTGSDVGGFLHTPGLESIHQGTGEVRGVWAGSDNRLYAVVGSNVYRANTSYAITSLGTLPNSSGRVSMADNGSQLVIAHQDGWHYVGLGGTAIASVTGAPRASVISCQDNYIVFTISAGQFGITALGDATSIDALDFATAEGSPDDLVTMIDDHRELWLFGTETTEIWTNTGAALFPFERAPGGFIEQGCAAKWSPAKIDNSVFWLGRDRTGRGVVYRANAYIPQRVSTHAIEFAINQGEISDAIGHAYSEEGQLFYQLTFPTQGQTWVFDAATKLWHQRLYMNPDTGAKTRHRANCYAFFNGEHIVGDFENGKIYRQGMDINDDDGDPIYRERAWEMAADNHRKTRVDQVELLALMGDGVVTSTSGGASTFYAPLIRVTDVVGEYTDISGVQFERVSAATDTVDEPIVWLQVSKDSGRTWGYERQRTLGQLGQYKARARWRRLGTGRDLVFRICTTMRGRVYWVDAPIQSEAYSQ